MRPVSKDRKVCPNTLKMIEFCFAHGQKELLKRFNDLRGSFSLCSVLKINNMGRRNGDTEQEIIEVTRITNDRATVRAKMTKGLKLEYVLDLFVSKKHGKLKARESSQLMAKR